MLSLHYQFPLTIDCSRLQRRPTKLMYFYLYPVFSEFFYYRFHFLYYHHLNLQEKDLELEWAAKATLTLILDL